MARLEADTRLLRMSQVGAWLMHTSDSLGRRSALYRVARRTRSARNSPEQFKISCIYLQLQRRSVQAAQRYEEVASEGCSRSITPTHVPYPATSQRAYGSIQGHINSCIYT